MNLLNLLSFILAVVAYTISQLAQHGKLRWMYYIDELLTAERNPYGFWGKLSDKRKYKTPLEPAPKNWYYKLIGSKYKERWPTSTWITVNFTDGYHACQSLMFIFLSLSLSISTTINFFLVWGSVLVVNFVTYRVLQK